jgi:hypothetical protein
MALLLSEAAMRGCAHSWLRPSVTPAACSNPNADAGSPKRLDDNSYENVWKKGGKVTITAKAVVSADGKTLTITQTGTDVQGRAVNTTSVFDRQ